MVTYVVGLTGGVASGKSTVAGMFNKLGVPVIDTDAIARSLVTPQQPAWAAIVQHFGQVILNDDETLNRPALRQQIFTNPREKEWLENLLHPLIYRVCLESLAALKQEVAYAILDIPLLIESKVAFPIDAIWVVDCASTRQSDRLIKRDKLTKTLAQSMLSSQATREERLSKATVVLLNDGSFEALEKKVIHLHHSTLAQLSQSS